MATTQRTIELTTADGHTLEADAALPDDPSAAIVVCHPHPLYGGNRFNPVVGAIFDAAIEHDLAAIRFDFRADHGGGIAERADVTAAIDEITRHAPGPVVVAGYSFGAAVALTAGDERIDALVAIAPPLTMFEIDPPQVPTLVLVPQHDQITDVEVVRTIVDRWDHARLEVVASADHFLAGHTTRVADLTMAWLESAVVG